MNCWPSGKYVQLLYMYSILGRGSFCFYYCLNSAWYGGDQFVGLLRWYGSPGFFDSGLQLICIFWSLVSHFPLDKILYGVQVWWVCWPVNTSTPWSFNQILVLLASVGRWQILLENEISIFKKLVRRSMYLRKISCKRVQWHRFSKNTMYQHQQMTLHPKSSQIVET